MKKYSAFVTVITLVGACSIFGGGDDVGTNPPKERLEFVPGPVVHPITGRTCNAPGGYCIGEIPAEGKSGCHSSALKCPLKK